MIYGVENTMSQQGPDDLHQFVLEQMSNLLTLPFLPSNSSPKEGQVHFHLSCLHFDAPQYG